MNFVNKQLSCILIGIFFSFCNLVVTYILYQLSLTKMSSYLTDR